MKKPLIFILLLFLVACGSMRTGAPSTPIQGKPLIKRGIATKANIVAAHTPDIRVTVGHWHLRQQASATGASVHIPSGTTIEIIATDGDWYLIQTIEENPENVFSGFIHSNCCVLKEVQ